MHNEPETMMPEHTSTKESTTESAGQLIDGNNLFIDSVAFTMSMLEQIPSYLSQKSLEIDEYRTVAWCFTQYHLVGRSFFCDLCRRPLMRQKGPRPGPGDQSKHVDTNAQNAVEDITTEATTTTCENKRQ